VTEIRAAIQKLYARFDQKQSYCVAYSGGVDSQVLLHALAQLKPPSCQLRAIHIHHGLQKEADQWAEHCAVQAEALKVPLILKQVDAKASKGQSQEAYAREARYEAFAEVIRDSEVLLTAHNLNDQAETVLLQMLRGAGVKGLAAMPEQRHFALGTLYRPLLGVSRQTIEEYAHAHHLSWVEDPSNLNTHYDRNFLRQKIMPVLTERWPSFAQTIARSAQHCAEASALIESVAENDLRSMWGNGVRSNIETLSRDGVIALASESNVSMLDLTPFPLTPSPAISIKALLQLSRERQRLVIRSWLTQQKLPLPSSTQLECLFRDVIEAREDKMPLMHWPGVELRRYQGNLWAMRPLEPFDSSLRLDWDGLSPLVLPGDLGVLYRDDPRLVSMQSILSWPDRVITICFRQGGEKMRVRGRQGRHELKKLFQEWGVLPWLRDRVPLLYVDDELMLVLL
jgi:tRNA(Ile)-lysidine synthase